MSTLSDLELAYQRAMSALDDIREARFTLERERKDAFGIALNREIEEIFGEKIRAAVLAEEKAREALEKEKERVALEEEQHPYPLGTRLVEWKYRTSWCGFRPEDRVLTGRTGVLEVITSTSLHPLHISDYSRAKRGDLVVRILKKDGTPSKAYERIGRFGAVPRWVPEGTDLLQEDLSWPRTRQKERD